MKYLCALLLIQLTLSVAGQNNNEFPKQFSAAEATEDLQFLQEAMQEAQTGLYRYVKPDQLHRVWAQSLKAAQSPMRYPELLSNIARWLHVTGCSHSGWFHPEEYIRYQAAHPAGFPFDIKIVNSVMYVARNFSGDTSITEGSRIMTINGTPARRIYSKLAPLVEHEGHNQTHIAQEMESDFRNLYSSFIDTPAEFRIGFIPPGMQQTIQRSVAARSEEQLNGLRVQLFPGVQTALPLQFHYHDSLSAGIYTIASFSKPYLERKGQDFTSFTDSVFARLEAAGARSLILDLRNNHGGWTAYSKMLLSYFIDQSFPYVRTVQAQKIRDFTFQHSIVHDAGYSDSMIFVRDSSGLLSWTNNPNLRVEPAAAHRFHGQLYVLINGNTLSAASGLAAALRLRTSAIFAGEESGGAIGGSNGMSLTIRLPHSHIEVMFSTAVYTLPVLPGDPARGIIPDKHIVPFIGDFLAHYDPAQTYILQKIRDKE